MSIPYSTRVEEETKEILRNEVGSKVVSKVLNKLARDYESNMNNTEVILKEIEIDVVDNAIESYTRGIERLEEHRATLVDDLKELKEVQRKEQQALTKVWQKLCKLSDNTDRKYDYMDVHRIFQSSLMLDEELTVYCLDKIEEQVKPLINIPRHERSETQKIQLTKWKYMYHQVKRLEEVKLLQGDDDLFTMTEEE